MPSAREKYYSRPKDEAGRTKRSQMFAIVCLIISSFAVVILVTLLGTILISGKKTLINDTSANAVAEESPSGEVDSADEDAEAKKGLINWNFLTSVHKEDNPEESGIGQAIMGSAFLCLICAAVAIPIGIGTAIFLEEFQPRK